MAFIVTCEWIPCEKLELVRQILIKKYKIESHGIYLFEKLFIHLIVFTRDPLN